jgi:hypothetical protein
MKFTFSLRRLMIGITILCVVAGLAVSFPWYVLAAAFAFAFLLPAAGISFLMSKFSWRPTLTFAAGLNGAIIATLGLGPVVFETTGPVNRPFTETASFLAFYKDLYLGFAGCAALGAVVAAAIALRFTGKPLPQ